MWHKTGYSLTNLWQQYFDDLPLKTGQWQTYRVAAACAARACDAAAASLSRWDAARWCSRGASPAACVVVAAAAVVPECVGEPAMRREKKESLWERGRGGCSYCSVEGKGHTGRIRNRVIADKRGPQSRRHQSRAKQQRRQTQGRCCCSVYISSTIADAYRALDLCTVAARSWRN